jgi:UDP-N-acetyl-D-galactosamine dehydrogenase
MNYSSTKPIAIIGLGYVGIQLAIAFDRKADVIGFDINKSKIEAFQKGIDVTKEVGNEAIQQSKILFTNDPNMLDKAMTFIVAVPTPVNGNNDPDLEPLRSACEVVGEFLKIGSVVVFESTVYPGITEDFCLPILESKSELVGGIDFHIGYSPERLSPGDFDHTLDKVIKIISGINQISQNHIKKLYELILKSNMIYMAKSIRIAESAKLIENTQRDIMIAFMNECSMLFNKLNLNIYDILDTASTKWNFCRVHPGLVGGHCIGVDPYYLIHFSESNGHIPQVIKSSRYVNENMSTYIAKQLVDILGFAKNKKVLIYGVTYKENVSDIRNTKVAALVSELSNYGICVYVADYLANAEDVQSEYNLILYEDKDIPKVDAIIFAVNHTGYYNINLNELSKKYKGSDMILFDLYRIFDAQEATQQGYIYWTL